MDHVTPDLVKRAYEITGLRPVIQGWGSMGDGKYSESCGCPLSAVCVAMEQGHPIQSDGEDPAAYVNRKLGLSPSYIMGFTNGIDGVGLNLNIAYAKYSVGHTDGAAVLEMMLKEGLLEG